MAVKPLPFQSDAEVGAAIPKVVAHLRGGGLLAYPTETVYGLGSRAAQADVAALAAMKGRAASKPFLLLISDRAMAEANGLAFNASADALARAFWPGPLTLVLPGGSGRLPDLLRGPDGGIAVRWAVSRHDPKRPVRLHRQHLPQPNRRRAARARAQGARSRRGGNVGRHRRLGRRSGFRRRLPRWPGAGPRSLRAPRPFADPRAGGARRLDPHDGPASPRPCRRARRRGQGVRAGRIRRQGRR